MAEQPCAHFHAGKPVALGGKARHFLVGEPRADRQAFEILRILEQLLETAPVTLVDGDYWADAVDHFVERAIDLRRRDLQRIGRIILREHDAVAVGNDSPIRHDRRDRDAVLIGLQRVLAKMQDLQVQEAQADQPEADEHEQARGSDAQAKLRQLLFGVLEFGHALFATVRELFDWRRRVRFLTARVTRYTLLPVRWDAYRRGRPRGAAGSAA